MKRIEIAVLIGIIFTVCVSSFTAFAREWDETRGEIIRLHVIPNSNEESDQQLKLSVRDAVLNSTMEVFTTHGSKQEIKTLAAENIVNIERIAQDEVYRLGYDYTVQADIVNMFFGTRVYGGFTLPAGHYDAIRVTIGKGQGENWWCVMFPPMCIPAATPESGEISERITSLNEEPRYKAGFALVEFMETIRSTIGRSSEKINEK